MSTKFAPHTGGKVILRKNLNLKFGEAPGIIPDKVYTVSLIVQKVDKVMIALGEIKHHESGQVWCYNSSIFQPFELPECLTRFLHEDPNYLVVAPDKFDINLLRSKIHESFKGRSPRVFPKTPDNDNKKPPGPSPSY
jgi:hypothetical protein